MPRYKFTIEYDGKGYVGWQRQDNGISIQQTIEEAIESFCQEKPALYVAGRTDAGVHALGQVAHCDLENQFPAYKIRDAVNFYLRKKNIIILDVEEVDDNFNARTSARKRIYLYRILNRRAPPAIRKGKVWHIGPELDIKAMKKGAKHLLGKHDFSSFRASLCQAKSPIKTLDILDIKTKDDEIHITAEARSFLHHMVRNMVGTLHHVGVGKMQPDDVKTILKAKDRTAAGPTAPAHGLYLVRVEY